MRLFCFPFAGGRANTFSEWEEHLPHVVEVVGVELPGRGLRFAEPPFTRIGPLLDALEPSLLSLANVPVLLFGHSMGSLMAFEMARRVQQQTGQRNPVGLFVSAQPPPRFRQEVDEPSKLSQKELLERLSLPPEISKNHELLELLMPVIRADFELTETYHYVEGPRLACPVAAFCGTRDQSAPASMMQGWNEVTSSDFRLFEIEGDHFFLNEMRQPLLRILKNETLRIKGTLKN